jgi:hypothetical protein
MALDFSNPYYPYAPPNPGWLRYRGISQIPKKIIDYLLDLPDSKGYQPTDDNSRPRVRLMKLLWYDGEKPLEQPLPTPEEKLSLVWRGEESVLNEDAQKAAHPKGYRIYGQSFWLPADFKAGSFLKVYMGRILPYSEFDAQIGLTLEFGVNYQQDNNMKTNSYSRIVDMEEALLDALHGVNIEGVGGIRFNRRDHMDNGSHPWHDDGTNIGRTIGVSIDWSEANGEAEVDACGGC